jgi:hypothetical protein
MYCHQWRIVHMARRSLCGFIINASTCAGAGIIAQVVTYPLDTVRRRLEVNGSPLASRTYSGAWNCAVTIAQKEGIASLYRGCLINCLKIAPSATLQVIPCCSAKGFWIKVKPLQIFAAQIGQNPCRHHKH